MTRDAPARWLVLLYQFPTGPDARRVKIWRRLQRIGAVALKNSVYVLPDTDASQEDLRWLLTELDSQGAEAALLESRAVGGLSDADIRGLFNAARSENYRQLGEELQTAIAALSADAADDEDEREAGRRVLARVRKRLEEIGEIDFFSAPGRDAVDTALRELAARASVTTTGGGTVETSGAPSALADLEGRVWVTRRGVRVDRIASAWLIRRWIDPAAPFRFVAGTGYEPAADEVRFDMFEAEYTHEGDRCTFEVLARLVDPADDALRRVGEIVHDIDLKDAKFGRAETDGVAALLAGIVAAGSDDEQRIERGRTLFDDLYRSFSVR